MQTFHTSGMQVVARERDAYVLTPSDKVDNYHGSGAAAQFTVPADATRLVFAATGDFWALYGANPTAVVPAATVTNGTASIPNPALWRVVAGQKVSVVATAGVDVALLWYS